MSDNDTATYQDFLKDFQPGASLGSRYKILKTLGAGGMGRVFMAHDQELDIDVALKVIRPEFLQSEKALERFKNELILARKVSHKNVVRIHDIGEVRGLKYLSMTYIPGKSLKEILRDHGGLNSERAVNIFTQICEGVAAAHEEGIIHRDLKPANVMIDENDRVFLTDFGIAKWLDAPDETGTGALIGTPAYLSPEQTWGQRPDARSDIYSLGLILYEILAAALPFDHENAISFKSRLPADFAQGLKKTHPEIPGYLVSVLKKCLDPRPSTRYQSVAAILHDLKSRNAGVARTSRPLLLAATTVALLALIGFFLIPKIAQRSTKNTTAAQTNVQSPVALPTAVILPFRNKTGKEELQWIESTMSDLLISDLSQTGDLHIVNSDRVFQTLKDLKISPASYDSDSAKKLAALLDADLLVQGNVTQAGAILRADAELTNLRDANKTSYFKVTGNKQEDLLPMVDRLAQQIHQSLKSRAQPLPSVSRIATPSISALKAFNAGVQYFRQNDYDHAAGAFNESILKDPKFAAAYLKLSQAYEEMGQEDQAVSVLQKGIELANQTDEKTSSLIRARAALLQGNVDNAISGYERLSRKYPQDSEICLELASIYEQNEDLPKASATLERVIRADPNNAQAYFQLGKDTILLGESEKAISQYLIKALSLQTQLNNRYGQADVLNAMGVAYERLGRYNDALKYYQDSLALKEEVGNKKGATKTLTNIANIYIFQSDFEKAKSMLNRALAVYQQINDQPGVADVQNTFGVIYENQGNYDQALKYYKNSLQLRKDLGDDRLTALSYDNIGQIYYLTAHYDEAQAFSEQALALRKKIGDQNGIVLSQQNMGFLQIAQGNLDSALKYFLDALNQARAIHFENAIAVSQGNLGSIYQNQGRYNAALDSYQEAIDVLKNLKDKKGEAEYTKLMASTLLDIGSIPAAQGKLNDALKLSEQIGSGELITDVHVLLCKLARMQGDSAQQQKSIDIANQNASKNHYDKGLLAAKIEKGLYTRSTPLLNSALEEANDLHDVWLSLASQFALASLYLQTGDAQHALLISTDGVAHAKKMGALPYLYRFHSIAAQASSKLKDTQKAAEHYHQAAASITKIRSELKQQYVGDFNKLPEVKATDQWGQSH